MTVRSAFRSIVGDLQRFEALADRIEVLVDLQIQRIGEGPGEWLILPLESSFYLFSTDSEGQRRGREVITAFLGPSMVSIETTSALVDHFTPEWEATGFTRVSRLRRVAPGRDGAKEMLRRLENLASTLGGRPPHRPETGVATLTDLLRDLRLAYLQRDDLQAVRMLDQVRLSGQVSAENLRFLKIEYLAAFGRWDEMRALPHISTLIRARRPRAISEHLIQMLWWGPLSKPRYASPQDAFAAEDVLSDFGQLLRSVRIPSTHEGRVVCMLAALAEEDAGWRAELIASAADDRERTRLEALATGADVDGQVQVDPESPQSDSPFVAISSDFNAGRYDSALAAFVEQPKLEFADQAVEAVLDSQDFSHAESVLEIVRHWIADGTLDPRRRLLNDLDELSRQVGDVCVGWMQWADRVSGARRWADAAAVLRNHSSQWESISQMAAVDISKLGEALIAATASANEDQVRSSLDLLCATSSELLATIGANDFCRAVVLILGEQENFSAPVREAYSELLGGWLQSGPSTAEYREAIELTAAIWARIESVYAVDWAIDVLDAASDAPCPDTTARASLTHVVVGGCRQFAERLGARQRAELESLARERGMPATELEVTPDETSWRQIDDATVGLYSLLPRSASALENRLRLLCNPREVVGNADKVATPALRSLATRVDYLIVDTWHAAHSATGAIDDVRPRSRQILPRQKGVSGFLRALEDAIST